MISTTEVRVRYADTDAMGVVYHANYLVWFEVGRVELMRSTGIPYTAFEEAGLFVPVAEAGVKWLRSARYDDLVTIETRVLEFTPARIKFGYRVLRKETGEVLCEGWTLHGFISKTAGRPVAVSKAAPELYAGLKEKLQVEQ